MDRQWSLEVGLVVASDSPCGRHRAGHTALLRLSENGKPRQVSVFIEPLTIEQLELPPALFLDESKILDDRGRGRVFARACEDGDWCWFWLKDVGAYRYPRTTPDGVLRCALVLEPGCDPALGVDLYYRTLAPVALQVYGLEALHGAAVLGSAGAIVLLGPSRSGKTTLACELVRRGKRLVADDAVVVDVNGEDGRPVLRPLPFTARLRDDSASRFDAPVRERVSIAETVQLGSPVPLSAFVILARRPGEQDVRLERLGLMDTLSVLTWRSYAQSTSIKGRFQKMIGAYLRLAGRVPAFKLTYPDGFDRLAAATEVVQRLGEDQLTTA